MLPQIGELTEPLTVESALAHVASGALSDAPVGMVGLEVETQLVDLADIAERVSWQRLATVLPSISAAAGNTAVTVEPGGQVEFSGAVSPDISSAVAQMRIDVQRARMALQPYDLGLAHLGADPLRPPCRINPNPRYAAMEDHFAATGRSGPGGVMMTSTAALQVNLQAGPAHSWAARVAQAHRLGPTLIAVSACSPWLGGQRTGWRSSRQQAWTGLDPQECGPLSRTADPAAEWAGYAMRAPVVFFRTEDRVEATRSVVSFGDWVSGAAPLGGRMPTAADLDVHLTTLFPPVRLRGYLELRYLDMSPPRWWPAVAAVVTTLMDNPRAADASAEAAEPAAALWTESAREGLANPVLAQSARRCLAIALEHVGPELAGAVNDLAALVESGRCPGDLLAARIAQVGPAAAFGELAYA